MRIKFLSFLIPLSILAIVSCQDNDNMIITPTSDGLTDVEITISAARPNISMPSSTRAVETEDGTTGEMMRNWTIIAVQNDTVRKIMKSESYSGERGEDATTTRLSNGNATFYSFANINTDDFGLDEGEPLPQGFDSTAVTVNGNQQAVGGFANGIPMSNKQTVTITPATSRVDLQVIRMAAKMRVEINNPTDETLKVTHLSLTDITRNTTENVKLMPGDIGDESTGQRIPNINDTTNKETFTYDVPDSIQTIAAGNSQTYEFYVNESRARQDIGHFMLSVTTDYTVPNSAGNDDSTVTRQRYAFTDWNSIARNEIHIVPVSLRRYRIDLYVRPYTAIGVLPKYDMEDEIATIDFGLYGHYDLIPRIRDLVTGKYYSQENNTYRQGFTVVWQYNSTHTNYSTVESDDITIDSLKLATDSRGYGLIYDIGGWDGDTKNYPTIGWNATAGVPRIECRVGNYTGWAIYTINAAFTPKGSTTPINLVRRFRISNTYVDLSQLAKGNWFEN